MDLYQKHGIPDAIRNQVIFLDASRYKTDPKDQLGTKIRQSFREAPDLVRLVAGLHLWRFVSNRDRTMGYFSDCWIDSHTMAEIMNSFRASGQFGGSHKRDFVRNTLAILTHWNRLDYRLKIELKKDVVGYIGPTGSQKIFRKVTTHQGYVPAQEGKLALRVQGNAPVENIAEHRIGGHTQFVVPRLAGLSYHNGENEYGKVMHHAAI